MDKIETESVISTAFFNILARTLDKIDIKSMIFDAITENMDLMSLAELDYVYLSSAICENLTSLYEKELEIKLAEIEEFQKLMIKTL